MPLNHVQVYLEGEEIPNVKAFEYRVFTRTDESNGQAIGEPKAEFLELTKELVAGELSELYSWAADNKKSNVRSGKVEFYGSDAGGPMKVLNWTDGFVDELKVERVSETQDPTGQPMVRLRISARKIEMNGTIIDNHFPGS